MFPLRIRSGRSRAKCYTTYGIMGHVDAKQPPAKKHKPWSAFEKQAFVNKVDVIFPDEIRGGVMNIINSLEPPSYHRVFMSLEGILEDGTGSFLSQWVKTGKYPPEEDFFFKFFTIHHLPSQRQASKHREYAQAKS